MRRLRAWRRPLGGGLLAGGGLAALFVAACSSSVGPPPGAVMVVIDTNLKATSDIDGVGLTIRIAADGGTVFLDDVFDVAANGAVFPATFAIIHGTDQPIDIKVVGYKNGSAITEREAITTLPPDRTAALQMDIDWLDKSTAMADPTTDTSVPPRPSTFSSTCGAAKTSISGGCTAIADVARQQELADGGLPSFVTTVTASSENSAVCFDVDACFAGFGTLAPAGTGPVDANGKTYKFDVAYSRGSDGSCSFAAPAVTTNLNVGLRLASGHDGWCTTSADGDACILPLARDAVSGWFDDGAGRVQLPKSICTDATRLLAVVATTEASCATKTPATPACQQYPATAGGGQDDASTSSTMDATLPSDASMIVPPADASSPDAAATDSAPPPDNELRIYPLDPTVGGAMVGFAVDADGSRAYVLVQGANVSTPSLYILNTTATDLALQSGPITLSASAITTATTAMAAAYPLVAISASPSAVASAPTRIFDIANPGAMPAPFTFPDPAAAVCAQLAFAPTGTVGTSRLLGSQCGTSATFAWQDVSTIGAMPMLGASGFGKTNTVAAYDSVGRKYGAGTNDTTYSYAVQYGDFGAADASAPFAQDSTLVSSNATSQYYDEVRNIAFLNGTIVYTTFNSATTANTPNFTYAIPTGAPMATETRAEAFFIDASTGQNVLAATPTQAFWLAGGSVYTTTLTAPGAVKAADAALLPADGGAGNILGIATANGYLYWLDAGHLYKKNVSALP